MVAAWISALTGVGPSMASGSHTCSGNCADLPIGPMKTRIPMRATRASLPYCGMSSESSVKLKVPKVAKIRKKPSMKPKSASRLKRNAFWLARAALSVS